MKLRTIGRKIGPPRQVKIEVADKRVDPFYVSAEWRTLMARIIARRGRCCQDPEHEPHHPREGVRIYGDHIVERRDGGALLDERNILLRCPPCHGRKTAAARASRMHTPGGD